MSEMKFGFVLSAFTLKVADELNRMVSPKAVP
jgi:hypothetical protein